MLVRISLVQHLVGAPIGLDLKLHLFRQRPDFVCFPEYWGATEQMTDQLDLAAAASSNRLEMQRLSATMYCAVVGGTVVLNGGDGLRNVAPVYESGRLLGDYAKVRPTSRERERGVVPGNRFPTWSVGGVRIGVAICADCLDPVTFTEYGRQDVDVLFVPNASPYREGEAVAEKFLRDDTIFVSGAERAGAYVVKTCGVGRLFGGRLQGRSLVASPWGILHRVPPDEEGRAQVVTVNLSVDELREFRQNYRRKTEAVH